MDLTVGRHRDVWDEQVCREARWQFLEAGERLPPQLLLNWQACKVFQCAIDKPEEIFGARVDRPLVYLLSGEISRLASKCPGEARFNLGQFSRKVREIAGSIDAAGLVIYRSDTSITECQILQTASEERTHWKQAFCEQVLGVRYVDPDEVASHELWTCVHAKLQHSYIDDRKILVAEAGAKAASGDLDAVDLTPEQGLQFVLHYHACIVRSAGLDVADDILRFATSRMRMALGIDEMDGSGLVCSTSP